MTYGIKLEKRNRETKTYRNNQRNYDPINEIGKSPNAYRDNRRIENIDRYESIGIEYRDKIDYEVDTDIYWY